MRILNFATDQLRTARNQSIKYRVLDTLENTDKVMNDIFWIGVYPGMDGNKAGFIYSKFYISLNRYGEMGLHGSVISK